MKKILTLLALTLSLITVVHAQKPDGTIQGKLMDTSAKQPVNGATVSVLNAKDSSLATFTLSTKQGTFEIKGLAEGDYKVIITFKGLLEQKKLVSITATNKIVNLGTINLEKGLPDVNRSGCDQRSADPGEE